MTKDSSLMPNLLEKFINLLLFGNFWIAACAVALTWQTELILFQSTEWTLLTSFVFWATLFLYAVHRIVGLVKVKPFLEKYRYNIIYAFRNHIKVYALIGGIGASYCFFFLSTANQILLIVPALLSLGYVLPLVKGEKRLRDFDYIKIFLVAIVWGVITVIMPILERTTSFSGGQGLILLERMLFIFAITLPFDIRDLKIDAHIQVKTIPGKIGIAKTQRLAYACLGGSAGLAFLNYQLETYPLGVLIGLFVSFLTTAYLIFLSDKQEGDYFFTGVMDGTMLLQFGLVWCFY